MMAENRRNVSLHEIERRRPALGQATRRAVHEIEDVPFRVLEPPAKGKKAA
jgi:hypothetical protein